MKALHNTQPTSGYRVNSIEILEQYPKYFQAGFAINLLDDTEGTTVNLLGYGQNPNQ